MRDCHAEVLARRGLLRFFLSEIKEFFLRYESSCNEKSYAGNESRGCGEEENLKRSIKVEEEELEFEDMDAMNPYKIPFGHEAILKGHAKGVSALALDPAIRGNCRYKLIQFERPTPIRAASVARG